MEIKKRVTVHVTGRVQGVGYRYFAVHVAKEFGLMGQVRNTHEGGVETVAEGDEVALGGFIKALQRGPHAADVDHSTVHWAEPTNEFTGFQVV